MKQFISIFVLALAIASCGDQATTAGKESTTTVEQPASNESSTTSQSDITGLDDVNVDTLGMAEFLAMKAADAARRGSSNGIQSNDHIESNGVNVDTTGFAEFKRLRAATARQAYNDSISRAEIIAERKRANATRTSDNTPARSTKQNKSSKQSVSSDETEVATATPEPVKEKKGWSKKAKGAIIGAATGAAAGAIINKKNRGVGGVVGGVVGGAAGYGIGRSKDKKDEKKESAKDSTQQQQ